MRNSAVSNQTKNRIDLHLHSSLSDGENTVAEIIELAHKEGMKIIALTDHNLFAITKRIVTGDGDLEVIPGCEFSCTYKVPAWNDIAEIHVIGLFPDGVDPDAFTDVFSGIAEGKLDYVRAILAKLETLGIHISMDEVMKEQRKTGHIGRHQIGDVLIRKGFANTIDEAFDRFVGNFSPHYIPATRFVKYANMDVVVKKIKEEHGLPILCHPFGYSMNMEEIDELVKNFSDAAEGIGGIEVYYECYLDDAERMQFLYELQMKYGLLPSAASDRHRSDQPFATRGDHSLYQDMVRLIQR